MSIVFFLLAAITFAVKVFNGHIGDIDLVALGLLFLTIALMLGPVSTVVRPLVKKTVVKE